MLRTALRLRGAQDIYQGASGHLLCMRRCTLSGDCLAGGRAPVGQPWHLWLHTADAHGNARGRGGEAVTVEVTGPDGSEVRAAAVLDARNGSYSIAFTPDRAGRWLLMPRCACASIECCLPASQACAGLLLACEVSKYFMRFCRMHAGALMAAPRDANLLHEPVLSGASTRCACRVNGEALREDGLEVTARFGRASAQQCALDGLPGEGRVECGARCALRVVPAGAFAAADGAFAGCETVHAHVTGLTCWASNLHGSSRVAITSCCRLCPHRSSCMLPWPCP